MGRENKYEEKTRLEKKENEGEREGHAQGQKQARQTQEAGK